MSRGARGFLRVKIVPPGASPGAEFCRFSLYESDEAHLGGAAAARADAGDAGVAAVAVGVLRCGLIEDLVRHVLAGDEAQGLAVGRHVLLLAERYHLLGKGLDLLRAGEGGLVLFKGVPH